jgi:hypothetical protein
MSLNHRIKVGLYLLIKNDGYLLANNLNERTVTHKLAEHYQHLFMRWNVDCEYNRNLGNEKKVSIDPNLLLAQMANTLEGSFYQKNLNLREDYQVFSDEEIRNLEQQLRNPKLRYDEELEIFYFILKLTSGKIVEKTIYPDIIIHQRGTSNNYVVIEAKKTSNLDKEARLFDIVKLLTLVKSPDFNYKQGVFIDLPVGSDFVNLKRFDFKQNSFDSRVYEINPKYV